MPCRRVVPRLLAIAAALGTIAAAGACASSPRRITQPPLGAPAAATTVQTLFESGRDDEVVTRAATTTRGDELWFSAQSRLRMGQRAEAVEAFTRLANAAPSEAFQVAARLALTRLAGEDGLAASARDAATRFPADAFVQFEVGLSFGVLGNQEAAARAFDAAADASPLLAYAYYQAGLAYSKLERPDLTVTRFETFVRLAPEAPERPQVETILRAARGR